MKKLFAFLVFFLGTTAFSFAESLKPFNILDISKIQPGKTNVQIKNLQIAFNKLGYTIAESGPGSEGNETGVYDISLANAIKEFQKENEITASGKMDLLTVNTLNKIIVFYNQNASEEEVTADKTEPTPDLSDYYSSDLSDVYNNDIDLDKNYLKDTVESPLKYVGSALKQYTGIDITGNSKNGVTYTSTGKTETNSIPETKSLTGNIFEDTILKTMFGDVTTLVVNSYNNLGLPGLSQLGRPDPEKFFVKGNILDATRKPITPEDVRNSKNNVLNNGNIDLYTCFNDPICSNI